MPQNKKSYSPFGLAKALLHHPQVGNFARDRVIGFSGRDEFLVLVKAAAERHFFMLPNKILLKSFAQIYARQPADVLEFMCLIRGILDKWETTKAGKVIMFLCKHRTIPIDRRIPQYNPNGECIAVVVKNLLDDGEKHIPTSGLSPDNCTVLLQPKLVDVRALLDKELGRLLNVNSESVKKARQEMSRISKEVEFWEHPAVVKYMKDGIMTPECGKIWRQYAKGKK